MKDRIIKFRAYDKISKKIYDVIEITFAIPFYSTCVELQRNEDWNYIRKNTSIWDDIIKIHSNI